MKTPITAIRDIIKKYDETPLKANPSFASRMGELYKILDLYWVSRYRDGDRDELGYKKAFFNIINFPVLVASKMLDLDTKSIELNAIDGKSQWPTWFMEKELKMWLREKRFGKDLNSYSLNFPKYGHLWLKKVGNDIKLVYPQNMIYDPEAGDLSETPNIEKHEYSKDQFETEAKNRNWENTEDVMRKNPDIIKVCEAWFPKNTADSEDNYFIYDYESGISLGSDKRNRPYKDLPWDKIPGRAPGRGHMETNLEEQIYLNKIGNYKSEGLHWSSKHLFQTRDPNLPSNLLGDVENGRIITANDRIEPVVNEERNLAAYREEEIRYMENALRKTFAREPITGGRAPAGTPLGSTQLQAAMASGFFKQKKEELADLIKDVLWDWVIPQFKNQKKKEHKLLIKNLISEGDESSEKFFNFLVNRKLSRRKLDLWKKGRYIGKEDEEMIRSVIAETIKSKEYKVPEGFYNDLKYNMEIVITGEAVDTSSKMTTLQTLFQIIGSNPTILQDKRARRILEKTLDYAGINPKDLALTEDIKSIPETAAAQRGGSIASPPPTSTPQTAPQPVRR